MNTEGWRKRLTRKISLVAGSLLVLGGIGVASIGVVPALADTSTGDTTANVQVLGSITLSGLTGSFTLSGAPGSTPSSNSVVTMNVATNNLTGYNVTVKAPTLQLNMAGATTGNTNTIPNGNLKVRETGQSTFTSISNLTATTVHNQLTRSATGGDTVSNDYQVDIPFVNADTYTGTLNYTASTNL
jgi:hypothetical protein